MSAVDAPPTAEARSGTRPDLQRFQVPSRTEPGLS